MEGFGYGLSAMVGGIFSGISDVVLKPVEETKNKGLVSGLTKGVLKGLGGAIIKPISGVFDFVSKTTEGIKNGVNDDRILNRVREPRVFYGMLKVIKEYNYNDAYVKRFLCNEIQEIKESEEYNFIFYGFVQYKNKRNEPILLVFVHNGFWIVDILRKELKGIIAYSDIKNVDLVKKDVIRIYFNKLINKESFYNIKLSDDTKHPEKIPPTMAERPKPNPSMMSLGFSVIFFCSLSLMYSSSWVKYKIPWLIPLVILEVLLKVPFTVCFTKEVAPSAKPLAASIGPWSNPSPGFVSKSWKPFPILFKKLRGLPKISIPPKSFTN